MEVSCPSFWSNFLRKSTRYPKCSCAQERSPHPDSSFDVDWFKFTTPKIFVPCPLVWGNYKYPVFCTENLLLEWCMIILHTILGSYGQLGTSHVLIDCNYALDYEDQILGVSSNRFLDDQYG